MCTARTPRLVLPQAAGAGSRNRSTGLCSACGSDSTCQATRHRLLLRASRPEQRAHASRGAKAQWESRAGVGWCCISEAMLLCCAAAIAIRATHKSSTPEGGSWPIPGTCVMRRRNQPAYSSGVMQHVECPPSPALSWLSLPIHPHCLTTGGTHDRRSEDS